MRERERNFIRSTRAMGMPMARTDLAELEHGRSSVEAIGAPGVPARLRKSFENNVVIHSKEVG